MKVMKVLRLWYCHCCEVMTKMYHGPERVCTRLHAPVRNTYAYAQTQTAMANADNLDVYHMNRNLVGHTNEVVDNLFGRISNHLLEISDMCVICDGGADEVRAVKLYCIVSLFGLTLFGADCCRREDNIYRLWWTYQTTCH